MLQDMKLDSKHLMEWKRVNANQNCEPSHHTLFEDWIMEWILLRKEKNILSYAESNALYLSKILFYQESLKRTLLRQWTVKRTNTLKHVKLTGH